MVLVFCFGFGVYIYLRIEVNCSSCMQSSSLILATIMGNK